MQTYGNSIEITVNGNPRQVPDGVSAAALVKQLQLGDQRIAMEVNGEILPRSRYAEHQLISGDRVEIIHAVGGG